MFNIFCQERYGHDCSARLPDAICVIKCDCFASCAGETANTLIRRFNASTTRSRGRPQELDPRTVTVQTINAIAIVEKATERKTKETLFILHSGTVNLDKGRGVSEIYTIVINRIECCKLQT
uniref:Uncharacterized protein n=1 Tax=Trichuris muris TaxID=70415 RepID=A0A5S6QNX7_TRIMR